MNDPLWTRIPRWIESSGLPKVMRNQLGLECWTLFRKLIAMECDANLTPDWFECDLPSLSQQTGLTQDEIRDALIRLEKADYIARHEAEATVQQVRILSPLPLPYGLDALRAQTAGPHGGRFALRYAEPIDQLDKAQRVVFLYQMVFGPRFTPRIVEDLEEISNCYDMAVIYDVFSEAHRRNAKHFSWIKSKLSASIEA
ncbi:MAG: hypothetical protein P9L94_18025 [Candidatus Hinthialibacter antarcticus]|nr:hypothetical protein [Candidatus Hinthialibacter antarcticus]